jgi:hypothetical protein
MAVVKTEEVPQPLRDLIPIAERWGIKHNPTRDEVLDSATPKDLRSFVHALEPRCSEIDRWLNEVPAGSLQSATHRRGVGGGE